MWRSTLLALVLAACFSQQNSQAIAAAPEEAAANTIRLDFSDLVSIQPAREDAPAVIFAVAAHEIRTRMVAVTRTRSEQRTRTVIADGKQVEQEYVVSVPYTEQVEQKYSVRVSKEATVPTAKIIGYDLLGKEIDEQELIDRLANPSLAFVLAEPLPKGAIVDPKQRAVLRDDVLLLYTPMAGKPAHQEPARLTLPRLPAIRGDAAGAPVLKP